MGGKRHFLSIGLADTPFNRKLAQDKALEIERDIQYGEFDPTLAKYRSQPVVTAIDPVEQSGAESTITLKELWQQYFEYKRINASPKTINGTYQPVTAHLAGCKTDGL